MKAIGMEGRVLVLASGPASHCGDRLTRLDSCVADLLKMSRCRGLHTSYPLFWG